jgi:hypothetical protein
MQSKLPGDEATKAEPNDSAILIRLRGTATFADGARRNPKGLIPSVHDGDVRINAKSCTVILSPKAEPMISKWFSEIPTDSLQTR